MSPEFEQVDVRTDQRGLTRAARFRDGTVFVPDCDIEEGEEIEISGEKFRVTRCEAHELEHRSGMLDERTGCLLTLETIAE